MGHGSIGYWVAKMVADSGYDELLSRVFGHLLGVGGLLDSVNHEICFSTSSLVYVFKWRTNVFFSAPFYNPSRHFECCPVSWLLW